MKSILSAHCVTSERSSSRRRQAAAGQRSKSFALFVSVEPEESELSRPTTKISSSSPYSTSFSSSKGAFAGPAVLVNVCFS